MKVLVTGANGFIGKNLISHLEKIEDIDIVKYDKENNLNDIKNVIKNINFIFHLAGVNRPVNVNEFYEGNADLTSSIINIINEEKLDIPILYTSSIQAVKDNDYGKSKKQGEDAIRKYGENHKTYLYRLHNVFGKWCRPNYNSVVATFCNNVANELEITINDANTMLELVYIDDVVDEFINVALGNDPIDKADECYYIKPVYKKKLGDIADLIKSFKEDMNSISIPSTGNDFTKKLFATFVSYIDISKMAVDTKMNLDERGSFTELTHTEECGQFSVSVSKPNVIRGNHYHHTKMERFIVVKGKAKVSFRHIYSDEVFDYNVDDSNIKIITIPPGYTHKIENVGSGEMILFIWCNEIFDKTKPDTYYCEV